MGQRPGIQPNQFGKKQKEAPATGEELARGQGKGAHIGHRFHRGLRSLGPFLIQAARQSGEPLGFEHLAHGGGAQQQAAFLESLTDFINGVVLFAQRDDQGAGGERGPVREETKKQGWGSRTKAWQRTRKPPGE